MTWLRRALFTAALGALALTGSACMGHRAQTVGVGGSGMTSECQFIHSDTYAENHPNAVTPVPPDVDATGSARCR